MTLEDGDGELTPPTGEDLDIIREAVVKGLAAVDASGLDKKFLRSAIWHAMVSSILEAASLELSIAILEDRSSITKGYGINGDSPIRILSPEDERKRKMQVPDAAEILYAHAIPAIDAIDDADRDGLSAFITISCSILKDWWGPVHFRRILARQISALRNGVVAPITPTEPIWPNKKKTTSEAKVENVDHPRKVNIFLVVGEVTTRWAITAETSIPFIEWKDSRTITGKEADKEAAIRRAFEVCLDVIEMLGGTHPEDRVEIISDIPDPSSLDFIPLELVDRFASIMRDRKVVVKRGAGETTKLVEKAKKAIDEMA